LNQQEIPREIIHSILSFIPAYPYYFTIRGVNKQWLYELEDVMCDNIEILDLVFYGRPMYYINNDQLVLYKPIECSGRDFKLNDVRTPRNVGRIGYKRAPVYRFLTTVFKNVKHLRTSHIEDYRTISAHLNNWKHLERLDIIAHNYSSHLYGSIIDNLVLNLPATVKTLCIENISLDMRLLNRMKDFVTRGVENLILRNIFISFSTNTVKHNGAVYELLKVMQTEFKSFEISVVSHPDGRVSDPTFPAVNFVDYVKQLMNRGEFMICNIPRLRSNIYRQEIIDLVIPAIVREYENNRDILDKKYSCNNNSEVDNFYKLFMTIPDSSMIVDNLELSDTNISKMLINTFTDIQVMKYPELLLNINQTSPNSKYNLITELIMSDDIEDRELIRFLIVEKGAHYKVDGIVNYLYYSLKYNNIDLASFFMSQYPQLLYLGNEKGIISGDLQQFNMAHSLVRKHNSTTDSIAFLVQHGYDLTKLDNDGNNIFHTAVDREQFDVFDSQNQISLETTKLLLNQTNNLGFTPIQILFTFAGANSIMECKRHLHEILADLVHAVGSDFLNVVDTNGNNLLHHSIKNMFGNSTNELLYQYVDINKANNIGQTPIFLFSGSYANYLSYMYDDIMSDCIKAGAKLDVTDVNGMNPVTYALKNRNLDNIDTLLKNAVSFNNFLSARSVDKFNALHFLLDAMREKLNPLRTSNKNQKLFDEEEYLLIKDLVNRCLQLYPEMLYERSNEISTEKTIEPVVEDVNAELYGVSPLQIILECQNTILMLSECNISLETIVERPIYVAKDNDPPAPIAIVYVARVASVDTMLFEKMMAVTKNVFVRDETHEDKPSLLHYAAETDVDMCKCVVKYWKRVHKKRADLQKLINEPLKKNKNGELILPVNLAASGGNSAGFDFLWAYNKSIADEIENPIDSALEFEQYECAAELIRSYNLIPRSKEQFASILNNATVEGALDVLLKLDKATPNPSWFDLFTAKNQAQQDPNTTQSEHSLLQHLMRSACAEVLEWFFAEYNNHPDMQTIAQQTNPVTNETLLHLLFSVSESNSENQRFIQRDKVQIFNSFIQCFKRNSQSTTSSSRRTRRNITSTEPEIDKFKVEQLLNTQDKDGNTCLHLIMKYGMKLVIPEILKYGVDVTIKNNSGQVAMDMSQENEMRKQLRLYLDIKSGKVKRKAESDNDDEEYQDEEEEPVKKRPRRSNRK
jgi:ankyrin repeat protein